MSVWKDSRELGKKAGEIASELAAGKSMDEIEGTVKFSGGPKGVEMNSYFIAPAADHQGKPEHRHRRWLDLQGRSMPGRCCRLGCRLQLIE